MTDFRVAFKAGQDAAIQADLSRKEIDDVFSVVKEQLAEVTDGKVDIRRLQFTKQRYSNRPNVFAPREKFWAIAVRNPIAEDNESRQIALWEQGRTGYPCKISWGGVDRTCHDRESLEGCLASLLEDAVVAEKLRGVMLLPPPPLPQNEPDDSSMPTPS